MKTKTMTTLTSVRYLQADADQVRFTGSNSIKVLPGWSAVSSAIPEPYSFI